MVYKYTKNTGVYKILLLVKKRRQFYLMRKGFLIDGLQVFEEYKSIQNFGLRKSKL